MPLTSDRLTEMRRAAVSNDLYPCKLMLGELIDAYDELRDTVRELRAQRDDLMKRLRDYAFNPPRF